MIHKSLTAFLVASCLASSGAYAQSSYTKLSTSFAHPPATARPWVYWVWVDGNENRQGITADLEAMKRVGIGGAILLDVDQSTPHGTVKFFNPQWQELFKFTIAEAKRLGLEINMNDGPGYYGSGGPWVPPAKAMQTIVQSETHITGGVRWRGTLPRPVKNDEYRDVAVLAIRETARSKYQIPDFTMKSLQWKEWVAYRGTQSAPLDAVAPADAIIPLDSVINISSHMNADGSLDWDAPAGQWTILRFGHAWNGHIVGPSIPGEAGPETDKLDKSATDLHFNAFVKHLNDLVGPGARKTLVATHIDSWEGGGQNWTGAMREEFKRRRGYDPVPYLPILTGRVLGDLQISERFLFDLRLTVSELMIQNYSAEFQRLAHAHGLRNTFESYTTIGNDLDNAAYVDEPMAEFWTPNGQGADFHPTVKSMSSAAHLNGHPVVGAEAFTSGSREKFLWHPAMIKSIGDEAFTGGVNRFVFHRYAMQPFADNIKPGMQMGPWGLHYERTNTWWEYSGPWHRYLTRSQYMLRQGRYIADVLDLESEEPLHRFQDLSLTGYSFDATGPETFLRGKLVNGRLAFPSGMQYRLILLPKSPTMSVALLTHIRDLVRDGAAVLGDPPARTPGLTDYKQADATLQGLVTELWGTDRSISDRALGKGRVFRGISPEKALTALDVAPDFSNNADLKFIHHFVNGMDIYFLSHPAPMVATVTCTFRATGIPELWDAETGRIWPIRAYTAGAHSTTISLPFEPSGSSFIVFRPALHRDGNRLTSVSRDGVKLMTDGTVAASGIDLVHHEISEPGSYRFTTADGRHTQLNVPNSPTAPVAGPWTVHFPPGRGAPPEIHLDALTSWSLYPDNGVQHFSGTATYVKTLTLPRHVAGQHLYLDLGKVQVMAKVRLNGKDLGILWKPPYRVDITSAARPGDNLLEVDVVNLWVNRLIGDEALPANSDRNPNGTLKAWPQWLTQGLPEPEGRFTFSSWRLWSKDDPLQESGLIGPVSIQTVRAF